eukprot:sb/3474579/
MLLKTQDANYINLKLQAERNKISKLKEVLHDTKGEKVNTHTVFVDSDSEDVDLENLEKLPEAPAIDSSTKKALGRAKKVQYNVLQTRIKRLQTLERASHKLQVYKNIAAAKGQVFKEVDEESGNVSYRWRKQRAK